MPRILVVAHRTLGGEHLLEEVGRRLADGASGVHLLVPVTHPKGAFTEASLHAAAEAVLEDGLRAVRALDPTGAVEVTGEIGDANPVYAVDAVVNRGERFDEIIVSTLPKGVSRWLRADVPSRLGRHFRVPVTHVVAGAVPAAR
jgi:hypothetical protein